MAAALVIPIGILALWYFTYASALTSQDQAQANTGWLNSIVASVKSSIAYDINLAVRLSKYIAHYMVPGLKFAEKKVAAFFAVSGTLEEWKINQQHRLAHAVWNVTQWASKDLKREIVEQLRKEADAITWKSTTTKAPPLPQRRLTQHEIDVEFQRLIEGQFESELAKHDPKFDWDPKQWRKWLGIIPALGSTVVHPHPTTPKVQPQPQPAPGSGTVTIEPPQPTTLPHTDDQPNPDPGTQLVPSVVSGKDKWARGQIVKLQKKDTSLLNHLGPLAFLTVGLSGLTTLIGLLECRNFGRFSRGICSIPTNLFNDLLGLLLDTLILADICDVMTLVQDGFAAVEGPLSDFIGEVGGALCHGDYDAPPLMTGPAVYLWNASQIAA